MTLFVGVEVSVVEQWQLPPCCAVPGGGFWLQLSSAFSSLGRLITWLCSLAS